MEDFVIVKKLGSGCFGDVYKVLRLKDATHYALKQIRMHKLSQKQKDSAMNQIRILASISHPNVIGYRDAFYTEETETLNIVMDFASNGDLATLVNTHRKNGTRIPEEEIWKVVIHAARGLKFLHSKNIVHRDLKGANIFVDQQGNYLLGDMNVSKVMKYGMADTQIGTPYYACPQVWQGIPYDGKADIWSLGCVIYEMAALECPFNGRDLLSLSRKIKAGMYPKLPSLYSSDLSVVVGAMLKVSPFLRISSSDLLQHPLVTRNYMQLAPQMQSSTVPLMDTIRFQGEGTSVAAKLPGSNYEQSGSKYLSFKKKLGDLKSARLREDVQDDRSNNKLHFRKCADKSQPSQQQLFKHDQSPMLPSRNVARERRGKSPQPINVAVILSPRPRNRNSLREGNESPYKVVRYVSPYSNRNSTPKRSR